MAPFVGLMIALAVGVVFAVGVVLQCGICGRCGVVVRHLVIGAWPFLGSAGRHIRTGVVADVALVADVLIFPRNFSAGFSQIIFFKKHRTAQHGGVLRTVQ